MPATFFFWCARVSHIAYFPSPPFETVLVTKVAKVAKVANVPKEGRRGRKGRKGSKVAKVRTVALGRLIVPVAVT
jgi:hypothetical protein